MKLYKARPKTVEAVEWTGKNHDEIREFLGYVPAASEYLGFYVKKAGDRIDFQFSDTFNATYEPLL